MPKPYRKKQIGRSIAKDLRVLRSSGAKRKTHVSIKPNNLTPQRRGNIPSNDLNQLSSDDCLSSTIEKNLESIDHVTSILGGIVHSITASRDLASVTLRESLSRNRLLGGVIVHLCRRIYPENSVGKGIFAKINQLLIFNLESGKVG